MSRLAVRASRLAGLTPGFAPAQPATVYIEDGVIARVVGGHPFVDFEVVGDGSQVVSAGLFDIHTHGAIGAQTIDGDVDGLRALGGFYARHGVTSYLATIGGSERSILAGLDGVRALLDDSTGKPGARCLGVHLEGPFISSCCPGAFDPASIVAPDLDTFQRFSERAAGSLRLLTLAPEVDGQLEIIRAARRMGVVCSAGHSAATEAEALEAISLGVTAATHVFNAMTSLHHRSPGLVGVTLTDDRLTAELICDGVHVHARCVDLLRRAKTTHGVALITDSIAAAGLPDGEYDFEEQHVVVIDGQARLADGTLAGSTLTLEVAVRNFAEFTGIPWDDAVVSATATPARLLGFADRKGAIAPGFDADLVGFDDDHAVSWTIVGGELVHIAGEQAPNDMR